MTKISMLLRELHEQEDDLAVELLRVSERHAADHEVHHVARDVARWSREHVRRIAEVAEDYGVDLAAEPEEEWGIARRLREKGSELVGRTSASGMLLLRDLRSLHLRAAELSLDWEMLGQAAQALKDRELLALAAECHPGTLRQMQWSNAMLKQLSPQLLTS